LFYFPWLSPPGQVLHNPRAGSPATRARGHNRGEFVFGGNICGSQGETRQLDALANFSGGSTTVTHHSQWTSADPSLATVADGLVTARASGSVQIAAAYGGTSATYTVKVQ
jgi:hypothetical protein